MPSDTAVEPGTVELPDIQHTCEPFINGGTQVRGQPATWALVLCCTTKFVCAPCLGVVCQKWSEYNQRCRLCGVLGKPGIKLIRRVVPL
jgi:hypothetical protein